MSEWQPIETAPKDGTIIRLAWFDGDNVGEWHTMRWGHIQKNGLFPGVVGMWVSPGGEVTWNDHPTLGGGPTHWMPHKEAAE